MKLRHLLLIALLVCVGCSRPAAPPPAEDAPVAKGDGDNRDGPGPPPPALKEFDKATVEAWKKRGFEPGWMGELRESVALPTRERTVVFVSDPNDEVFKHLTGVVPAFRYSSANTPNLEGLPPVGGAFGLRLTVEDAELKGVAGLKNLTMLVMAARNMVTDAGVKELARLQYLTHLVLDACATVTDAGLKHLGGLKHLTLLDLNRTGLTDAGLEHLAGLDNLASLTLGGDLFQTGVTGTGMKHLAGLKNLTYLVLKETNAVTDAGMEHIAGLKNLTHLSLSSPRVTDTGLKKLVTLKHLTHLRLGYTGVTDAGVKELQKALPNCKISK